MGNTHQHRVLVTGANGFIGAALCNDLLSEGFNVVTAQRQLTKETDLPAMSCKFTGYIDGNTDWSEALVDVDTVVHLAARVHVMKESRANPLEDYQKVNVEGTANLAEHAARSGVKRFVYLSSVKVLGEEHSTAYTENSPTSPKGAYSISKLEAENQLKSISINSDLQYVIIRPPLVYGPGVKANFSSLLHLAKLKLPLPLGAIKNRRSFIFLKNLVDCILTCISHPCAANQTYLVSDDCDLSTPDLIRLTASALNVPCRLFPLPVSTLRLVGRLLHKEELMRRLIDNLAVDISKIKTDLSWKPPYSVESGLDAVSRWFWTNNQKLMDRPFF